MKTRVRLKEKQEINFFHRPFFQHESEKFGESERENDNFHGSESETI